MTVIYNESMKVSLEIYIKPDIPIVNTIARSVSEIYNLIFIPINYKSKTELLFV